MNEVSTFAASSAALMPNYLAFTHSCLPAPEASPYEAGQELARQCLAQIADPIHFPPKLFILLAAPVYCATPKAHHLLAGIYQTCAEQGHRDINLLGSTVAAVFCDGQIYEQGALLVCLASRLMEVTVVAEPQARQDPAGAAERLLDNLGLDFAGRKKDPNPLVNSLLLTFFPGFGPAQDGHHYPAPLLHRHLRERMLARVPIVGGAASADQRDQPGWLFANDSVYTDALVAAKLLTSFPFTSSIGHGLTPTEQFLRVTKLAADARTVEACSAGDDPASALKLDEQGGVALLGELTMEGDPSVNIARRSAVDSRFVTLLREAQPHSVYRVLRAEPARMRADAQMRLRRAQHRLRVENPVGLLGFHCNARRRIAPDIAELTADVQGQRGEPVSYVGGFFDGEAGLDETGRSVYGNWSVATLSFGDEMRERAALQGGFQATANYAPLMTKHTSIDKAIEDLLDMVVNTGFPGAQLSLLQHNHEHDGFVVRRGKGVRLEHLPQPRRQPPHDQDFFSLVGYRQEPRFIRSSQCPGEDFPHPISELEGLVSQYLIPFGSFQRRVSGMLQIDLGDVTYKEELHESEQKVLNALGAFVEASLNRLMNWEELQITRLLDEALRQSLAETKVKDTLQNFIARAAQIMGADGCYLRRADRTKLRLVAGVGDYYQAFNRDPAEFPLSRRAVEFGDNSTNCRAFLMDKSIIFNDAHNDHAFQRRCARYRADAQAHHALENIGAYINAPVRNEENKPIGTLNLTSRQPWSFTRVQERSVEALTQRVGTLIGHLDRKIKDEKAARRYDFLEQVGAQFLRQLGLDDPATTLQRVIVRFRQATDAEMASLFLWDDEVQKFVLRAQDGWSNPHWLHVARYGKHERWTGSVALQNEPVYIPDLYAHKKSTTYQEETRNYASQVFGVPLAEDFRVEAIGLPLKLRDQELGVITLYRRINPRQATGSGFALLPPHALHAAEDDAEMRSALRVLQAAAGDVAELVSAMRAHHAKKWEEEEREQRRLQVYKSLTKCNNETELQRLICQQVAQKYHALRAVFYPRADAPDADTLLPGIGYRARPSAAFFTAPPPDERVKQTVASNLHRKPHEELQLYEEFHEIPPGAWQLPEEAIKEGVIARVCLPVTDDEQLIGVLDLRFGARRQRPPAPASLLVTLHNAKQLKILGELLGFTYQRQLRISRKKAEEELERRKRAFEAMSAMIVQMSHRLMNLMQTLRAWPTVFVTESPAKQEQMLKELALEFAGGAKQIAEPLRKASHMVRLNIQAHPLRAFLEGVLRTYPHQPHVACVNPSLIVPDDIKVYIDEELTKEAFHNILHNAIRAMDGAGALKIEATRSPHGKFARLIFADTGRGMNEEELQSALAGFAIKRGPDSGAGLGVLISRLLLTAQGGQLEITSQQGVGTQVQCALPLNPPEVEL